MSLKVKLGLQIVKSWFINQSGLEYITHMGKLRLGLVEKKTLGDQERVSKNNNLSDLGQK